MKRAIRILIIGIACIYILPIVHMVTNSFMSESQITQPGFHFIPTNFTIRQYYELLMENGEFFSLYKNSITVVVIVIIGQVLLSVITGYAFGRMTFKGRNTLFIIYIVLMLMPYQVLMVPNVLMFDYLERVLQYQLFDTHIPIIIPSVFSIIGVFLIRQLSQSIPDEVIEAARMDSASEFAILRKIVVPMLREGIIAVIIITFAENWNLIEQVLLYVNSKDKMLLSLYLEEIYNKSPEIFYAGSVLYIFPIIIIIFYVSRKRETINNYLEVSRNE